MPGLTMIKNANKIASHAINLTRYAINALGIETSYRVVWIARLLAATP